MKKLFALLMCFVVMLTSMGVAACGGGGSGDVTTIYVFNANGGTGTQWLYNLEKRFEAEYAEHSFAPGKTGVDVEVSEDLSDPLDNVASELTQIFFVKRSTPVTFAAQGTLLDVSEWITEDSDVRNGEPISIKDKIDADQLEAMAYNGGIYGIPAEHYFEGVSYDAQLWEDNSLYLMRDTHEYMTTPYTGAVEYFKDTFSADEVTLHFANVNGCPKSLGPDGEPGTEDDGLPSSMAEFLALCYYIKTSLSYSPVSVSGQYLNYSNLLVLDLWKSLAGDKFQAIYNLGDAEGNAIELEVVTGVSDTEYLYNTAFCKIPKPITETVNVTEANGYYARQMVERYYANALIEILDSEGWFATSTTDVGTVSHTDAQGAFVNSGLDPTGSNPAETIAMHVDGGYWWNESRIAGNFDNYAYFTNIEDGETRNIKWMSLPVQWRGSVTTTDSGNAHAYRGKDLATGICVVNGNILNKPDTDEILAACKAFVQFAFTDENMNAFTKETGMMYSMNYTVTDEVKSSISSFYLSQIKLKESQTLPDYNFNGSYASNPGMANFGLLSSYVGCKGYSSYLGALRGEKNKVSTWEEFQEGLISPALWTSTYYKPKTAN